MNVRTLMERLAELPEDAEVLVATQRDDPLAAGIDNVTRLHLTDRREWVDDEELNELPEDVPTAAYVWIATDDSAPDGVSPYAPRAAWQ